MLVIEESLEHEQSIEYDHIKIHGFKEMIL
jgi:hypothetical protein